MDKPSHTNETPTKKWYQDQPVLLTVIGVVGTIIAALISILPDLVPSSGSVPTSTPVPVTATIEISPTSPPPTFTATVTETTIPPTATLSPTPTETPTATPVTPPLSCLDRWEVISTAPGTVFSQGNCEKYSYPDLGIEPIGATVLSFARSSIGINETTGVATRFSSDISEISFDVRLDDISDGEFWIAFSDGMNPDQNAVSIRLQSNGLVRVYDVNGDFYTDKTWNELRQGTIYSANKPFYYKFIIRISGTNLNIGINNTRLNLSGRPDFLFLGYKNKSVAKPVTVFVDVSNLVIK